METTSRISRQLAVLRRRIRRVQFARGMVRFGSVVLGGLLLIAALDFIFAPLVTAIRVLLFFLWLAVMGWGLWSYLLRPLRRIISDVQLARWLEIRHPEVQERISTSLELAGSHEGISEELLAELSSEAATDLSGLDPEVEVTTRRVRKSVVPLAAMVGVIALLLAVFPQEMGRLLARAVAPFSTMGNAGGLRFEIMPGDQELIEGEPLLISLSYEGDLKEPLELVTRTSSGRELSEQLSVVSQDGELSRFEYQLHEVSESFQYLVRSGKSESDQFEITVYPKPSLENATVRYRYPEYTGWADRVTDLSTGLRALAGTEIVLTSQVPSEVEEVRFTLDGEVAGEESLERATRDSDMEVRFSQKSPGKHEAVVVLDHRLREGIEVARFPVEFTEDEAPVVKLVKPFQRELRMRPDDQIILVYEVEEQIGLSSCEIELEVEGRPETPLKEALPTRVIAEREGLWSGEAMAYVGSLLDRHPKAKRFKLRLKLSDNRPAELDGPGVGYSDWIEVRLDQKASSLARQELQAQQSDIRETIEEAIRETRRAQVKMRKAQGHLHKEEVSKQAVENIDEARDELAAIEEKVRELAERMEQGVQAHRSDEAVKAADKLSEAKQSVEMSPLQDTPESRRGELDAAVRASDEAVRTLEKLRDETNRDRQKIEELARLQEMAQRQDSLARQAEEGEQADGKEQQRWQNQQEQLSREIREMVKRSPQAKQAALEAQAERAAKLEEEARALAQSQEELKNLSEGKEQSAKEQIAEALKDEQSRIAAESKEAASEGAPKAEEAREATSPQEAAEAGKEAAEKMAQEPSLQKKQETVAEGFEALAEGNTEEALGALETLQRQKIEEALKQEQGQIAEEVKGELSEAREENEDRANTLPEAVAQAEAARDAGESIQAAASAQAAAEALKEGEQAAQSQQDLQDRQEKVAEAFQALAEGKAEEALAALEELQAEKALELAEELSEFPLAADDNQALQQAQDRGRDGANRADQAMKEQANGQSQQAAQFHGQSSEQLEKAGDLLAQAAQDFAKQAEQAGQQQEDANAVPAPGEPLAEAFEQSSEAANADSSQAAASSAKAAAEALKSAAQQAQSAMSQNQQPGQGAPMAENESGQEGQPGNDQGSQPGDQSQEGERQAQADPGVPPELARLGVSAGDWAKIKATLKSEIGGARGAVVPEDYRGLVKKYFEQVTQER
ncbi:MAG: hypothetical protein ACSHYF_02845 [Verrucomicrobiaceae bacterium]